MKPNGLVVSVDYGDLLAITLPRNIRYCQHILVVSTARDEDTRRVVQGIENTSLYVTDVFYRNHARFNKGAAVEEGLDTLGRSGWLLIWDADILFPEEMDLSFAEIGKLYTPHRRMLTDPGKWTPELDWADCWRTNEKEFPGYFQLFHADDPLLVGRRPWYGTNWRHAGGCDSDFQQIWPDEKKVRPPFEVLHLGEDGKNWSGRATVRVDGTLPPHAEANAEAQRRMMERRRRSPQSQRYRGEKIQ